MLSVCFPCPAGSLAWASDLVGPDGFSPAYTGWLRPGSKKKKAEAGLGLGLSPSGLICFGIRMCLTKYTLMSYCFIDTFFYFDIWQNSISGYQKISKKFIDLFKFICRSLMFFVLYIYIFHCIINL